LVAAHIALAESILKGNAMRIRLCAGLLGIAFVLSAQSWATTLPSSCGDEKTVIDVTTHKDGPALTAPEAGKALVVFIETADKNAQPVTTRVALDGAWVGANKGNSYFASTVLPGEHHVCTDWQLAKRYLKDSPAFDVFTAEAGKTYYFVVKVGWVANVNAVQFTRLDGDMSLGLSKVNEDEGKYMVQNSRLSTSTQKK
jgi:hypothetical protein